ncbi:ribosomal RNA-processing protein 7-domain-containing protein [Lipomyces arxii]|uniref:ribosomal RNA-processing protein 7-domain-containing protein n=1 Tax=Lipomyces arxii TaxID=56418 RepID=UPI0034CF576A
MAKGIKNGASKKRKVSLLDNMPADVINGYFVLPMLLPAVPKNPVDEDDEDEEDLYDQESVKHFLYIRKHSNPGDDKPSQTLFIANLPINTTTLHIHVLFSSVASISSSAIKTVTFLSSPTGSSFEAIPSMASLKGLHSSDASQIRRILPTGSACHVLFSDQKSFSTALAALSKRITPPVWRLSDSEEAESEDVAAMCGSARYLAIHKRQYLPSEALQATVDSFVAAYNKAEAEKEKLAKRALSIPDEDGFVTVSRQVGRTGAAISSDALREEAKKRQKKGELKDFYRYQVREEKKARMNDLLKNFKMDQEKILELKAKRKFKPFSNRLA